MHQPNQLAMEILEANIDLIQEYRRTNLTYQQISNAFQEHFPELQRGFSVRNIRLVCSNYGLKKATEVEVDQIVQHCVNEVRSSTESL